MWRFQVILCVIPSIFVISVFIKYHIFWAKLRYINIFRKNYLKHVVKNNYIIKSLFSVPIIAISHTDHGLCGYLELKSLIHEAVLICVLYSDLKIEVWNTKRAQDDATMSNQHRSREKDAWKSQESGTKPPRVWDVRGERKWSVFHSDEDGAWASKLSAKRVCLQFQKKCSDMEHNDMASGTVCTSLTWMQLCLCCSCKRQLGTPPDLVAALPAISSQKTGNWQGNQGTRLEFHFSQTYHSYTHKSWCIKKHWRVSFHPMIPR